MNAIDPAMPPVRGLIDGDGRLVSADDRLVALNARAGGAIGAPLAVPQVANLVRLARRLRVLISRRVTVADGDDDVELWVRAEPEADGVRLSLTGWTFRNAWTPDTAVRLEDEQESGDWAWETDAALRLTQCSAGAAVRAGIDPAALLGQPVTRLFALSEAVDGGFPILAAVANQGRFEDQHATLRDSGRAVVLAAVPRHDAEGRFAGFAGTARLIDDTPAVEQPVAGLPAAFSQRLDRALRAPIGRIVADAEEIGSQAAGALRAEYVGYAADIATAGRHLLGLVDDLVDVQFVEREAFAVAREAIDLSEVARRAAGLLAARAEAGRVRIDWPDTDEVLPAIGEYRRALQILVNLIGNAVRYSPADGMVWIRLQQEGPAAAVIVADQGKGIAIADQARIFEKFERVDPTEPGGSGLGLYISRRLARAMGGDIVVDSAPGQGARFVFTLPAR